MEFLTDLVKEERKISTPKVLASAEVEKISTKKLWIDKLELLTSVLELEMTCFGKMFKHKNHSEEFLLELKQKLEQLSKSYDLITVSTDADRLRYDIWSARNDELKEAWLDELDDLDLSDLRKLRMVIADERFYRLLGIFEYSDIEKIER